jgi:hypothetical protein
MSVPAFCIPSANSDIGGIDWIVDYANKKIEHSGVTNNQQSSTPVNDYIVETDENNEVISNSFSNSKNDYSKLIDKINNKDGEEISEILMDTIDDYTSSPTIDDNDNDDDDNNNNDGDKDNSNIHNIQDEDDYETIRNRIINGDNPVLDPPPGGYTGTCPTCPSDPENPQPHALKGKNVIPPSPEPPDNNKPLPPDTDSPDVAIADPQVDRDYI